MKIPTSIPSINPITLADILFQKENRTKLFLTLDLHARIELLATATQPVRRDILMHIPSADFVKIIEALEPDQATDLLRIVTHKRREDVLAGLSTDVRNALSTLLEFDPETAAGLMKLDYVQADVKDTIESIALKFKNHEKATGRPPVILVTKDDKLSGFLPGHELGLSGKKQLVGKLAKRIPTISYAATHDRVVDTFRSHPHGKVVVLNDAGSVVGIIYSDDVLRVMDQQETSSLYGFAGVSEEESVTDSARRKVGFRYKWLIINLLTAFLAAAVVGQFEETISKNVLLAVYMPIVAGMGGNAATQTLAVLVRGISLKQIRLRTALHTLRSEVGAGATNGLINGFLVALVVLLKDNDPLVALVLALAMVVNLIVAATFGTLVPLIMSKLKKDPATSATIFITTATDVLGFLTFLGLATIILG